ncbi:DUF502 domain-containing protein [bacterium]|nr:DUF502 domain-containing protein [bacterium]
MIVKKSKSFINFLKTTAIGGLLFLLPLIVLGALVGQIAPLVVSVASALNKYIPIKTATGVAILVGLSIAIILLLCFGAGMFARWSLGKKISTAFEKKLALFFPRYSILKDQMADTIGGNETRPQMKPVLVVFDEYQRIAFETERDEMQGLATIYLPGSPDPWSGKAVIVKLDRVTRLHADFGHAAATCEQVGRGSIVMAQQLVKSSSPSKNTTNDASVAANPNTGDASQNA